jgi:hypothetical protein
MENIEKMIAILNKQNEGMELSLKTRDINFTKCAINNLDPNNIDPKTELIFLKQYNEYLKNISKQNRPPPQVKEEKQKEQPKPKEKPKSNEDEENEEDFKETKPIYSTIANMEDIKRAFFSKEYDTALELIKQHPFKYYSATYKYASDNTGRPSYVAKNLLRGFVQGLDDYRKYFMICFRCIITNKEINEYNYPSYWIVNTNDDLKNVIGSVYDDYDFLEIEEDSAECLLKEMRKHEDDNDDTLIGEVYLH